MTVCRPETVAAQLLRKNPACIFNALCCGALMGMGHETEETIRSFNWTEIEASISPRKFTGEMLHALTLPEPDRFFRLMIEFHVGSTLLPELFRMPAIPAGPPCYHPEGDLFIHSLQVLQRVSAVTFDPVARFCGMFHDIGKLATDPDLFPRHHGHDRTGFVMAGSLCDRLQLPDSYKNALMWTCRLHLKAGRWQELRDSSRIRVAEQAISGGIKGILPIVVAADKTDKNVMDGWKDTLNVAQMELETLGIDSGRYRRLSREEQLAFVMQKRVEALRRIRS